MLFNMQNWKSLMIVLKGLWEYNFLQIVYLTYIPGSVFALIKQGTYSILVF